MACLGSVGGMRVARVPARVLASQTRHLALEPCCPHEPREKPRDDAGGKRDQQQENERRLP